MFRFGDEISIPLFVLEDRPLEKFFKTTQDIIQVSTFHNECGKKYKKFVSYNCEGWEKNSVLLQYFALSQQHISFISISLRIFENTQRLEGL